MPWERMQEYKSAFHPPERQLIFIRFMLSILHQNFLINMSSAGQLNLCLFPTVDGGRLRRLDALSAWIASPSHFLGTFFIYTHTYSTKWKLELSEQTSRTGLANCTEFQVFLYPWQKTLAFSKSFHTKIGEDQFFLIQPTRVALPLYAGEKGCLNPDILANCL